MADRAGYLEYGRIANSPNNLEDDLRYVVAALTLIAATGCAPGADSAPSAGEQEIAEPVDHSALIQTSNDVLMNQGDFSRINEFFAPDYRAEAAGMSWTREQLAGSLQDVRVGFPDLRVEVEVLSQAGDRITWLRTHRGTHEGEFLGAAPTGREVVWRVMVVSRVVDGLIAQEWAVTDFDGAFAQPE